MFQTQLAGKLLVAHATKDGKSKIEGCSNQWRWIAKKSSSDDAGGGSSRGATSNFAASSSYAEDMYKLWLKDKSSVHSSWDRYFTNSIQSTHMQQPLDKEQLVQYVHAKRPDSTMDEQNMLNPDAEMQIRGDEGPIVIKIDIINDPHEKKGMKEKVDVKTRTNPSKNEVRSDGKSMSTLNSTQSEVKSAKTTKSGEIDDNKSLKSVDSNISIKSVSNKPPTANKKVVPSPKMEEVTTPIKPNVVTPPVRVEPVEKLKLSKQVMTKPINPKKFVEWQQHVNEFARYYLRPTRGVGPEFPIYGKGTIKTETKPLEIKTSPPKESLERYELFIPGSVIKKTEKPSIKSNIKVETPQKPIQYIATKPPPIAQSPTPDIKTSPKRIPPNPNNPPSKIQTKASAAAAGGGGAAPDQNIQNHQAVMGIIRSYQTRGHLQAFLDPLGILDKDKKTLEQRQGLPAEFITRQHTALKGIDLNTKFALPNTTFIGAGQSELPLKEIIQRLEQAYSHHIGVEFMYIQDMEKTLWIRQKMETLDLHQLDRNAKIKTLQRLIRAVHFESFLAKKYTSEKRFGLEGCDVMIPCIKQLIDTGSALGVDTFNISMPHRGRLNVLANICRKSLKDIFTTFIALPTKEEGSGDVKYHLGTVTSRENRTTKKKMRIAVIANPSHLEACNAVGLGKCKCEQFLKGDTTGDSILGIYLHGDASFCGQGAVYEAMHLSYLPNYTTHGAIHVVVNNQVGFTTDPRFSRSSPYCTDVARVVLSPIFHVNADDPEAVIVVSKIAAEWRQKFKEDVVIDLVSYRRNGHNEMDEPMFTQPLMYQIIKKRPNIAVLYAEQLIKEGVTTQAEVDAYIKEYESICEKDFSGAKDAKIMRYSDWLDSPWKGFFKNYKFTEFPKTGISEEVLTHIGKHFSTAPPPDFVVHRGITRILKNRMKLVDQRITDWSLGEAFAYGSLMKDGYHVRLSGQDVERGTFSHRHHVLHHQTEDKKIYNMLANMFPNQAPYSVCNSSLSEFGVLAFEVGYSLVTPYALVMWEGQYGDFANSGQVVTDQYVCSGQAKWYRQMGLVMQLPHGLEGAGPEHSSARLERYLSLCDDDVIEKGPFDDKFVLNQHEHCNWFVANCTVPASLFHILRRQLLLPFRKPLVLMTPKVGLRHPLARSSFDEFLEGTQFQRLLPENGAASKAPDQVKKLIFCSGKTYFDIFNWRQEAKMEGQIAVARAEQIAPFPYDLVAKEIGKYKNAKVFWAQEEHSNQGAWGYVHERINGAADNKLNCQYNGRASSSSPATGNNKLHGEEVAKYKADVLKV